MALITERKANPIDGNQLSCGINRLHITAGNAFYVFSDRIYVAKLYDISKDTLSFVLGGYLYTDTKRKLYILGEQIMMSMNRRKAARQPYEGYKLPAVSEKGGQFVDFNHVVERKPIKKVKVKRNRNGSK
jgi:hypothetical protein